MALSHAHSATTSEWSHVDEDDLASSGDLSRIVSLADSSVASVADSDAAVGVSPAPYSHESAGSGARRFEASIAEKELALRAATDALARLQSENQSLRAALHLRTLERDLPVSDAILKSAQDVQRLMDDLSAKMRLLSYGESGAKLDPMLWFSPKPLALAESIPNTTEPIHTSLTHTSSTVDPPQISKNQLKKARKREWREAVKATKSAARAAKAAEETVTGHSAVNDVEEDCTWLPQAGNVRAYELMREQAGALLLALLKRHKVLAQATYEELQLQEKGFYRLSRNEMEICSHYPETVMIDGEPLLLSSAWPERGAPVTAVGSAGVDMSSFSADCYCEPWNRESAHVGSDASTEIGVEYLEPDEDEDVAPGDSDDEEEVQVEL